MKKGKRGNNIVLIKNTCLVQRPGRLVPLHNSGTERIKSTDSSPQTFLGRDQKVTYLGINKTRYKKLSFIHSFIHSSIIYSRKNVSIQKTIHFIALAHYCSLASFKNLKLAFHYQASLAIYFLAMNVISDFVSLQSVSKDYNQVL